MQSVATHFSSGTILAPHLERAFNYKFFSMSYTVSDFHRKGNLERGFVRFSFTMVASAITFSSVFFNTMDLGSLLK